MAKQDIQPILIADDDPLFRELAAACLEAQGYETVAVGDGAEALETLSRDTYSLAIIDLDMPRIDGWRLIALVRAMPRYFTLPIIVASGSQNPDDHAQAQAFGVNQFLQKPIDWVSLPSRVATALDGKAAGGAGTTGRK